MRKITLTLMVSVFFLISPLYSHGDVIYFKDGKKIETPYAWEEGNFIKCERFGGVMTYPKSKIEKIVKEESEEDAQEEVATSDEEVKEETPFFSGVSKKKRKTRASYNIEKQLSKARPPKNKIESASIGTVTVLTGFGSGSGFFITKNGHLLTNRHVVQLDEGTKKQIKEYFKYKKAALKRWKKKIKAKGKSPKDDKEYQEAIKLYNERLASFKSIKPNEVSIVLVDDTELKARVIKISKKYDLALLKLEGHKTPFLTPNNKRLAQGKELYAIGSPLNIGLSVSSGIFSGYRDKFLQTNIPINAGNSGGPVITPEGEVVGINTWKISGFGVEGLSFAIPIEIAIKEFSVLRSKYRF